MAAIAWVSGLPKGLGEEEIFMTALAGTRAKKLLQINKYQHRLHVSEVSCCFYCSNHHKALAWVLGVSGGKEERWKRKRERAEGEKPFSSPPSPLPPPPSKISSPLVFRRAWNSGYRAQSATQTEDGIPVLRTDRGDGVHSEEFSHISRFCNLFSLSGF